MRKNEKITALYERLSRDDFGKDDDQQRESNSSNFLSKAMHKINASFAVGLNCPISIELIVFQMKHKLLNYQVCS